MKKFVIAIGVALVVLVGYIGIMGVMNDNKTAEELVAEAYLINEFGDDDYDIEIAKIEDGMVYFYYNTANTCGYNHTTLANINGNS